MIETFIYQPEVGTAMLKRGIPRHRWRRPSCPCQIFSDGSTNLSPIVALSKDRYDNLLQRQSSWLGPSRVECWGGLRAAKHGGTDADGQCL
jgi:hypothetical protein